MIRRDFIKSVAGAGAAFGVAMIEGRSWSGPDPSPTPKKPGTPPDPDAGGDSGEDGEDGPADDATPMLSPGKSGDAVQTLQERLGALGYWCGTPDGAFGPGTTQAVLALQKVAGLSRDAVCGPASWKALAAGTRPQAGTSSGHVIEIHRDTQVLLVVDSGSVTMTLATCTGSERPYESKGRTWSARTTPGSYHVYYRKDGWDEGPLGRLYRPMFFNGGIAVHGSTSVPPYPASHGCCRLTVPAMDMMLSDRLIRMGTAVVVY